MEKLDYWNLVNFLLLKQNPLTYSCLTDTKLHVHVVIWQYLGAGIDITLSSQTKALA